MNKQNEFKAGYKNTKAGWIPEEWVVKTLHELCIGGGGYGAAISAKDFSPDLPRYIRITDITDDGLLSDKDKKSISHEDAEGFFLEKGDFLFARTGSIGLTYLHKREVTKKLAFAGYLIRYKPDEEKVNLDYLLHFTKGEYFMYWISITARRGSQPNINATEYASLPVCLPSMKEQNQIAKILNTSSNAVELVRKQIATKQTLRKGLIQQLIPGKLRGNLAIDELPDGWHRYKIGELLSRDRKPVEVNKDQVYQEIGIKSHTKGIFYKEKITGEELGNKSVFWVIPDRFILNIVFAWEQAVAKTTSAEMGMIASHRFPMYKATKELLDLDYLLYFFQTPYGKHLLSLASPGGAGRNKTLGQDTFMNLSITLPSVDKQRKIGNLIKLYDQELGILRKREFVLRQQKKGLMQKLLTGEVRVKV